MIGVLSKLPLPEDVIDIIYEYKWGDPRQMKNKFVHSFVYEQLLYQEIFCTLAAQYQFASTTIKYNAFYYDTKSETLNEKIIKYILMDKITRTGWQEDNFMIFCENIIDVLKSVKQFWLLSITRLQMKLICRCLTKMIINGKYDIKITDNHSKWAGRKSRCGLIG